MFLKNDHLMHVDLDQKKCISPAEKTHAQRHWQLRNNTPLMETCSTVHVISTCGSSLQSWTMCSDQTGVSNQSWISHSHIEGASRNVAAVELDIDGMNAILTWYEADGTLV